MKSAPARGYFAQQTFTSIFNRLRALDNSCFERLVARLSHYSPRAKRNERKKGEKRARDHDKNNDRVSSSSKPHEISVTALHASGVFNLAREREGERRGETARSFIVCAKQCVRDKLFVNRRSWKTHSADLSKVRHRYATMLTIYTRLVHPHPFVTVLAAMFYNRACHFRAKPPRHPRPMKNSNRRADCASIISRVSKTSGRLLRVCKQEIAFPGVRGNPLTPRLSPPLSKPAL